MNTVKIIEQSRKESAIAWDVAAAKDEEKAAVLLADMDTCDFHYQEAIDAVTSGDIDSCLYSLMRAFRLERFAGDSGPARHALAAALLHTNRKPL